MEDRILIVDDEKMIYSILARRLANGGKDHRYPRCLRCHDEFKTPSPCHACWGCHC